MFNSTVKTVFSAALAATVLSTTFAHAGGGGGEGGAFGPRGHAWAKVTNPDGSTRSVRQIRGGRLVTNRNARGRITERRVVRKSRASWAMSTDSHGVTRMSGRASNGSRFFISIGPVGVSIGN